MDPSVKLILEQGLVHTEIHAQLNELIAVIASLQNASAYEKPGIGARVLETVGKIQTVAETFETVKPYALSLVRVLSPFISAYTGVDIPSI